jgi:hypothetical protein
MDSLKTRWFYDAEMKLAICTLQILNLFTNDGSRPRWTSGPKVRVFDPDRGRWIFKGDKNPEHHYLRFTACKRTLRAWIKMLRKLNSKPPFLTQVSWLPDGSGGHIRFCEISQNLYALPCIWVLLYYTPDDGRTTEIIGEYKLCWTEHI